VEAELLASERRSLDILSVKCAKRSANEVAVDEEGKGETDLRFKSFYFMANCDRLCLQYCLQ